MANLDDFFKKKDTKKSKGKKFAVNNPLSLNSTENSKNGKVKQEKPTSFDSSLLTNENDLFSSQVRVSIRRVIISFRSVEKLVKTSIF